MRRQTLRRVNGERGLSKKIEGSTKYFTRRGKTCLFVVVVVVVLAEEGGKESLPSELC